MNTEKSSNLNRKTIGFGRLAVGCLALLFAGSSALAFGPGSKPNPSPTQPGAQQDQPAADKGMVHRPLDPEALKKDIPQPQQLVGAGIVERLSQQLPGDILFVDEEGKTVPLSSFYDGKKPVLVNPGYFGCPMLCGEVSNGLVEAVQAVKWTPGNQYTILTVSLNPEESHKLADLKKNNYMKALGMPGAEQGWRFLVVKDQANADRFIQASGFGFKWNEVEKEYAHAAGVILLMPDGKISRYLYGVRFMPDTLRLSLVEAADRQIGSTLDRVLLFCFRFDHSANRYTVAAMRLMKLAGAVTVLIVAGVIGTLLYREHRAKDSNPTTGSNDPNHPSSNAGA